jgi:hypothetical protein
MEEIEGSNKNRRGRPKGAKNKRKRGRPKKKKVYKRQTPISKKADKEVLDNVQLPSIKNLKPKENIIIPETLEAIPVSEKEAPKFTQDVLIDSLLNEEKLNEESIREVNKEINQDPVDPSYYYRGAKNIPIAGAEYVFTADMVEELRRCKEDIIYFAENFFYVVMLDKGKQKIKLYEAQKRMLLNMVNNRFTANLSCRQSGKSTLLTIFVLWSTCFNEDYRAAIVANKESTAVNIFKRIRLAYEQLPNYIKPGVKDYAKTGMTLGNDSSIIVSTTTATSIRGDTLNCICLDEAAFIESHILEEFWASVIPSISSGLTSKILMVSTPNGVGNKFYEIFSGAENGSIPDWKASRIDWWDVPGRDEAWKKTMVAVLGSEEKFSQEFGNTFLDNDACAIGSLIIERFKREKQNPIWTSVDGEYTVFEYPKPDALYVIGVDVGEGIGRAASVAQVLDVTDLTNIKQVAIYASTVVEPYHFANKLNTIGNSWGVAPMLVERNNCGAQVIDALHYKHNYMKIVCYNKISESEKYNRTRNMGVLSHNNIRFDGVQNMRYWINHLGSVRVNDPKTISEFETFIRHPNGIYRKRNEAFFDDRVMSLVWALFILEPEICQQYYEIVDFDNQHKPLKIVSSDYWEKDISAFELKDLTKENTVVSKPKNLTEGDSLPSLTEIFEMDKYELDVENLQSMGFQFLYPMF